MEHKPFKAGPRAFMSKTRYNAFMKELNESFDKENANKISEILCRCFHYDPQSSTYDPNRHESIKKYRIKKIEENKALKAKALEYGI